MHIRSLISILALLAAISTATAVAQDATPTATAPDPSLCTLRPLTPADLQRIAGQELPEIPTPTPVSDPFVMPEGEELFTHDLEEVEKDIERAIACVNTGEPLKALAAYTDRWIAAFLTEQGGLNDELLSGLQVNRDLQPVDYLQVLGFGEAVWLPDGRAAIVVTGYNPASDTPISDRLFLMSEVRPGRFLIDEVVAIPSGE